MIYILCIFIIISFFEVRFLVNNKEKKEMAIYIILTAIVIFLSVYMMLFPDYIGFSKMILDLFHAQH
jgi:hypothetical protein